MLRHSAFRTCRGSLVFSAFLVGEQKLLKYFHLDYSMSGYELFELQSILRQICSLKCQVLLFSEMGAPCGLCTKGQRGHPLQSMHPRAGWKGKALKLERHCLRCCCSATLFSMLGVMCHFQTTSLSWIFCPIKRTLNITTVSGFSSTAWELLRRPGLACLASCSWNAEPSCCFTFFLIFVWTDPYSPSMGVFSGFYFQNGGPGGCNGCSALWALIFSLPWAGGWRNHSTESDCCCDGL